MKYIVTYILIFILPGTNVFAQSLPDEMQISPDGKRLITGNQPYTGFYDLFTINDISLDFSEPDYWDELDDNYHDGDHENILATLTINGNVYDSVGVRFKGNTSYSQANDYKKSFNISLDAYRPDQNIYGYKTLNLHNCMGDPSFMAEVLYEHQISKHVPSPKGNFAHLFINGMDWGIYANVQQVNRDFIKEWFLDNEGALWRAASPPGISSHGHDGDSLHSLYYLGNNVNTYMDNYYLKSSHVSNPYQKLMTMISVMDTVSQSRMESVLGDYLDIDRTLWFLASENAFGDDDSYVTEARRDYTVYYEPETGRCVPIEIDGNGALEYAYHNQDIFLNSNNPNFALSYKLLNNPTLRQRYLAHMRTLVADEMNVTSVHSLIDAFHTLIDPIVQNDVISNYTYSEYLDEIDNIKDFITDRNDHITDDSEIDEDVPEITNAVFYAGTNAWQRPADGQSVYVNATVVSPDDVDKVTLYYSTGLVGKFSKITMRDDGQHHDQQSNDDIYGATIPGQDGGTWVRFYIEATSDNSDKTVAYDPPGAEHDVYTYLVLPSHATDTSVVINELMAKNVSAVSDSSGTYGDWIELYNNSSQSKNIGGYYLTDNPFNLVKWTIPAGTVIPPHDYLIIWADENEDAGAYHANFKFSGSGEQLILLNDDLEITDEISFGAQTDDLSLARVPNGTGPFIIQPPTFSSNNNPDPQAAFAASSTSGCAPFTVSFINNSTEALTFHWSFGDGSVSGFPAPVHTYSSPGNYTVTLTASNNGFNDVDSIVNMIAVTGADPFDFNADTVSTPAVSLDLAADPGYISYQWSNGGNTQMISAGSTGNYCVVVTSPNNCTDSDCIYVIVDALKVDETFSPGFVFSNPVDHELILQSGSDQKMNIEIFDLPGQIIYKDEFTRQTIVDTRNWPQGIYILRAGNFSKAIVVSH